MTPTDRRYTRSHQWVKPEGELFVIGITDHAQHALGDVTFVELPAVGRSIRRGEVCAVVESVKAASEIEAPLDGDVTQVNEALERHPTRVNQDPYEGGWLWKMRSADSETFTALLTADQYDELARSG